LSIIDWQGVWCIIIFGLWELFAFEIESNRKKKNSAKMMCKLLLLIALIALTMMRAIVDAGETLGCFPDNPRQDCGYSGINQQQCEAKGCCWAPVENNPANLPWCIFKTNGTLPPPWTPPADGLPFNASEISQMESYFMQNLNVCCLDSNESGGQTCQNCGGVVASPDYQTGPGGSYVYAWQRDAALSMRALMTAVNSSSAQNTETLMKNYVGWVLANQVAPDPNGIDVRGEPKFMLPKPGVPFAGGWCRPQNDGPGLRAGTLAMFAQWLLDNGQEQYVRKYLWTGSPQLNGGAIPYDLDYAVATYNASSCDAWEEIRSNDLFWNRYTTRHGLTLGAKLAARLGDAAAAAKYQAAANAIASTIGVHWNGQFVYESTNRQEDSIVACAFNNGYLGDGVFAPSSLEVAGTLDTLSKLFASTLYVNQVDSGAGVPGVLLGRYRGDGYDGGGVWILTSAALGQAFYEAGTDVAKGNALPSSQALAIWAKLLDLPSPPTSASAHQFAVAAQKAGDGVMFRIRKHVESYNFHLSEQLDRTTGVETSATDLTWSYSNVFKAMHARNQLIKLL
jgi:glucoamylase